jgi:hypothetical protein
MSNLTILWRSFRHALRDTWSMLAAAERHS